MICAVPALRALRVRYPNSRIEWIGLPWAKSFADRFSKYVDRFIEFPGFPGMPEQEPRVDLIPAFLTEMQNRRFDLLIQLHGNGALTNPLISCFGAAQTAGFYIPSRPIPDPRTFLAWREREHEALRYLRLLEHIGVPNQGKDSDFPLTRADQLELEAHRDLAPLLDSDFVCVHPGARNRSKCWPPEHFAKVADGLADSGLRVVLTGSAGEADLIAQVRSHMRHEAFDSARLDLPLGALAALISKSALLVSNDTGVSHLAAALQIPSVVIFSSTDPERWAPLNRDRHRVLHSPLHAIDSKLALKEARIALGLEPRNRPSPDELKTLRFTLPWKGDPHDSKARSCDLDRCRTW